MALPHDLDVAGPGTLRWSPPHGMGDRKHMVAAFP
jgi:hypothetical protein